MRLAVHFRLAARAVALSGGFCGAAYLAGCGMPAAPQPPSLKLPQPVTNLAARRAGEQVTLTWTMPRRDTSKVALKPDAAVPVRICRVQGSTGACVTAANFGYKPGADGSFTEMLPANLAGGPPRLLRYFVELSNRRGRSAGLSNAATVLAGQAPAPVAGLSAAVRKEGIVLRWTPGSQEPYQTQVRLDRTLLTPQPAKSTKWPLAAKPEPVRQTLLVPTGGARGVALDNHIRFGETYSYRAQRIARITVAGQPMELDSALSSPVRVDAENVFPPAVPTGLAAVATPAANGSGSPAGPSIDLSWQPDTESDLAGYAVYRREAAAQPPAPWQRISGAQPVAGPAYHDANVQPGRAYEYAVTAIGQNGQESGKSAPAEETVPGP